MKFIYNDMRKNSILLGLHFIRFVEYITVMRSTGNVQVLMSNLNIEID